MNIFRGRKMENFVVEDDQIALGNSSSVSRNVTNLDKGIFFEKSNSAKSFISDFNERIVEIEKKIRTVIVAKSSNHKLIMLNKNGLEVKQENISISNK